MHGSGDTSAEFSYRIVAIRKGYENTRMAAVPFADNDPNLYPGKQITQTVHLPNSGQNGNGPAIPAPSAVDTTHRQPQGNQ